MTDRPKSHERREKSRLSCLSDLLYSSLMRVRDLFNPMGVSQSFGALSTFLDENNCQVVNKTKQDKAVLLHLRRESDGTEGHAYMRVQKDYAEVADQLLSWAFEDPRIIGLTVNDLSQLETGMEVSVVNGRMQVSQSNQPD